MLNKNWILDLTIVKNEMGDGNMFKKMSLLLLLVPLTVLAACGNGNSDSNAGNEQQMEEVLPLEVEILTEADAFEPGVAGEIEAKVWQGEENIDDADEVVFEIWKDGHDDESENLDGESVGEGIYSLTYTFDEDGIYYVIAHVTARGLHTMPKKEFIVGDVDMDEHGDEEHGEHGHDHGDHGDGLSIHLMEPEPLTVAENTEWLVHLEQEGQPLTEAQVRLEYWKSGEDKHEFIETTEDNAGEYTAEINFTEPGEYHLTVHVEKDELHEHKESTFQVE